MFKIRRLKNGKDYRARLKGVAVVFAVAVLFCSCSGAKEGTVRLPPNETEDMSPSLSFPQDVGEAGYRLITAEQAFRMMNEQPDAVILDVRTEEEHELEHIPGAVVIPVDELYMRAFTELPLEDATILVYCRSGVRSARAASELAEMGYINVFDFGGILYWPYEKVSGE